MVSVSVSGAASSQPLGVFRFIVEPFRVTIGCVVWFLGRKMPKSGTDSKYYQDQFDVQHLRLTEGLC